MFQQMSSSESQYHPPSSSMNDQDELMQRRKLEQKRRFQQKQGKAATDVDSLMQTMFTDLKLQPKPTSLLSTTTTTLATATALVHPFDEKMEQTRSIASGAADWSKMAFDQELSTIFHSEEKHSNIPTNLIKTTVLSDHSEEQNLKFVYPTWCSQPIVFLPLVYQQVFEASCVADVIQTSVLYPILLLSGLRQEQLSQIWSQVNLTHPGTLVKEELFMALALIALAQNSNGHIYSLEHLFHLTEIPIPQFAIQETTTVVTQRSPTPPLSAPEPIPEPMPETVPTPSIPTYQQDDFADFTAFTSFEQSEQLDFDENHLFPPTINQTSSETQSIASLELPSVSRTTFHQEDHLEKTLGDTCSFSSSNNNDLLVSVDTQSLQSNEPSKLELTQFSFFSDEPSQIDSHVSIWLRCYEKCHSILTEANEIFSSIESPTLCTEILQQNRAREYVYHLQEIFHVQKRIHTAATLEPTTTAQLTTLWKQILVLWMNLQSFFSTAHLHLLNDDDIDYSTLIIADTSPHYCSICLLSTSRLDEVLASSSLSTTFNRSSLTFAGRFYHAPCANFYLNLIDGILPSLRRSS